MPLRRSHGADLELANYAFNGQGQVYPLIELQVGLQLAIQLLGGFYTHQK